MKNTQEWLENEFTPWKNAMADFNNKEKMAVTNLRQHAGELKYVVSLLLEKREREAVRAWNNLELEPALKEIQLDLERDVITFTSTNDEQGSMALQTMLEELQGLLSDRG